MNLNPSFGPKREPLTPEARDEAVALQDRFFDLPPMARNWIQAQLMGSQLTTEKGRQRLLEMIAFTQSEDFKALEAVGQMVRSLSKGLSKEAKKHLHEGLATVLSQAIKPEDRL